MGVSSAITKLEGMHLRTDASIQLWVSTGMCMTHE